MADLWRQEAVGIPVWEGAHVYTPTGRAIVTGSSAKFSARYGVYGGVHEGVMQGRRTVHWRDLVLNLTEPDTRMAFLRRLAIRLGCPTAVADEGVIAFVETVTIPASRRPDGQEYRDRRLYLMAGAVRSVDYIDSPVTWTEHVSLPMDTGDILLALVRAWKAVTP